MIWKNLNMMKTEYFILNFKQIKMKNNKIPALLFYLSMKTSKQTFFKAL